MSKVCSQSPTQEVQGRPRSEATGPQEGHHRCARRHSAAGERICFVLGSAAVGTNCGTPGVAAPRRQLDTTKMDIEPRPLHHDLQSGHLVSPATGGSLLLD